jgi:hypothetical protein
MTIDECRIKESYPFLLIQNRTSLSSQSAFPLLPSICCPLNFSLQPQPDARCSARFAFFRLPHSDFQLQTSNICPLTSVYTLCAMLYALCPFPTSAFRLPTSNICPLTSVYTLCAMLYALCPFPTSAFRLPTSNICPLTSIL